MARYPNATWKPLPEASHEPLITATQVILHSAVSGAASLYGYFSRADVPLESHFYVNQDAVEQYVDTARQADANRQANVRAISIETWDNRDPDHIPWTERQLDLLAALVAWCCRTHGIPALRCTTWTAPGIGWHTMWGAPSPWTPVSKTCPGRARVLQMPELLRRVQDLLTVKEDELDETTTKTWIREVLNEGTGQGQSNWAGTSKAALDAAQDARREIGDVEKKVDDLARKLDELLESMPPTEPPEG